jgi:hypothetical protein
LSCAAAQQPSASPAVQLVIEVVPGSNTCLVHENIPLTIRIKNPNAFSVRTPPGLSLGYDGLVLEAMIADGTFARLGSAEPARAEPLEIPAGATLQFQRFVYDELLLEEPWPFRSGPQSLRATFPGEDGRDASSNALRIEWVSKEGTIQAREGSPRDQAAWAFLARARRQLVQEKSSSNATPLSLRLTNLYRQFLQEYGDTPYAADVRRRLVTQVERLIASDSRLMSADKIPGDLIEVLEENVRYCLERGAPYSSEVLEVDEGKLGRDVAESLAKAGRYTTLDMMSAKLDQGGPEDRAAGLFLRAQVLAHRGDFAGARDILNTLRQDFAATRFGQKADQLQESISRLEARSAQREAGQDR